MLYDLDQYYTPSDVAEAIIADSVAIAPRICVDSTCGTGRLLDAANAVFGDVKCIGIDKDKRTIANLKRRNPEWVLSVADLLNPSSCIRSLALSSTRDCDLLVLNPPFSCGGLRYVDVNYLGSQLRASVAMAHILRSFDLFKPKHGAVIIVPESLLYSDVDLHGRNLLCRNYSIEKISELKSTTFKGARVRATAVRVYPDKKLMSSKKEISFLQGDISVSVTRGGLPVFMMEKSRAGVPFVHSTDIKFVSDKRHCFTLTKSNFSGRVSGWIILIPRVGVPDRHILKAVYFPDEIQISDCVIALEFSSRQQAKLAENRIGLNWDGLLSIYRGTGARYITIARLKEWLLSINFSVK